MIYLTTAAVQVRKGKEVCVLRVNVPYPYPCSKQFGIRVHSGLPSPVKSAHTLRFASEVLLLLLLIKLVMLTSTRGSAFLVVAASQLWNSLLVNLYWVPFSTGL